MSYLKTFYDVILKDMMSYPNSQSEESITDNLRYRQTKTFTESDILVCNISQISDFDSNSFTVHSVRSFFGCVIWPIVVSNEWYKLPSACHLWTVPKYRSTNVYTSSYIRHHTVQCGRIRQYTL